MKFRRSFHSPTIYQQQRQTLYQGIREEGIFNWDLFPKEEYALASVYQLSATLKEEIQFATEALGAIFHKTIEVVRSGSDELLEELGIPKETWGAIRLHLPYCHTTAIGRFDFANTPNGLKVLEFNSDTPTSLVEAFYVNGKVCDFFGLEDPNAGESKKITEAFHDLISVYTKLGYITDHIVFSSLGWHREDAGTTKYLLQQSGLSGRFVPIDQLALHPDTETLYAWNPAQNDYEQVDIWYRLHALEYLAKDQTSDGFLFGSKVLDTVAKKKLGIINPPSAFLAQTKAFQALIWSISEQGDFYLPEEHEIIRTYLLPTYLENHFSSKRTPFVQKPFFGREGGAVAIFGSDGELLAKDNGTLYWQQQMVYQEAVELEAISTMTLQGEYHGRLLWGSFLINGQASAIVTRVGGAITGNESYFLPISM
ncbi:glutathionylspermidine synthase family protein [Risungbinella massiliensis]|uniref:glutathionylspermidine synthase family protein n=1 Tax=Risungbinella massiliensis TaxID=1329796 RepID=UPI0005CC5185|nr:glutathionylspermidine synthase family protein [Risungbinella massiliensis]